METVKQCNFFYNRSHENPHLITVVITRVVEEEITLKAIQRLLELLFIAHPVIKRGKKRMCMGGHMKEYDHFDYNFCEEPNQVAFFTHDCKLQKALGQCTAAVTNFENFVDKYSHVDLMNVILGLYLQFCPKVLEFLFDYHLPYLRTGEYTQSDLETLIGGSRPSAYQLYITKDYCVKMHTDKDSTDFTLAYANDPDCDLSPIDFVIPEYKIRLPICNGDLFVCRNNVVHGIGYRIPSKEPAYVAAIAVNSKLDALYDRCCHGL